ncbi:MAG TPA: L-threonylcarbamoyladenylate synthase [Pyrinomonadaceae bacterium]|nr:L-threonylcarbamoyladenylate synthase [Pyrinomonadaceae bacterium]
MDTLLTTSPAKAAEIIQRGGTVAFPTETVYGLGANVFDVVAIEKIFAAKQRPPDNPLIAHVGSVERMRVLTVGVTEDAELLVARFFPGPLTIVLKKSARVPAIATGGLDTIGIRMPRHQLAREFLAKCGEPIVAPSANLSGRPSPTTWRAVVEDLGGRIDCILQGDDAEIGLESTVVDCTGDVPIVLRMGAVSIEELRHVVPATRKSTFAELGQGRSPGLRHRHYSPNSRVVLIAPVDEVAVPEHGAFIGLHDRSGEFRQKLICASVDEYAHSVFEFFREADRQGVTTVYCETVSETGIGAALMDRLRRAAED